jgi:hypothetical protein
VDQLRTKLRVLGVTERGGYIRASVLVLVLYQLYWLPGVIANLAYLALARKDAKALGHSPRGRRLLQVELVLFAIVPFLVSVVFLVMLSVHCATGC